MLWLICMIAGIIIVSIITIWGDGYWEFIDAIMGAFFGLAVYLVLITAFTVALEDTPMITYECSTTKLIALNDGIGNSVHGTFFLGTGHVNSEEDLEYRFIYRTEKGMTVGERKATRVYLEYVDGNEIPRLVKYGKRYENKFWDWLLGAVDTWEVFYVPEGSITNNIMIDLA